MTEPEFDHLLQPFSARSLVASALLGSHPPALPGRLLVAMGERFGISGGTTRVALSRMVDRGELSNEAGIYTLSGDLLQRQERQDRSRSGPPALPWDGSWEQAIVTSSGRSASDRGRLRHALGSLGLGELREGVWLRPANLDVDRLPGVRALADGQVAWFRVAPLAEPAATDLVARLYDLDGWVETARALHRAIGRAHGQLATDDDAVVSGFTLASATLRHLVHDPQLPDRLVGPDWPAEALRQAYEDFERAYQRLLRDFFRAID